MSVLGLRTACFAVCVLSWGCQSLTAMHPEATAELHSAPGSETTGRIRFTQLDQGVQMHAVITGLAPRATYELRLGDASACEGIGEDGRPVRARLLDDTVVELPALKTDYSGRAEVIAALERTTLRSGPAGLIGRSVLVRPSYACGVIRAE